MQETFRFCSALSASCSEVSLISLAIDTFPAGSNCVALPGGTVEESFIICNEPIRILFPFGNLTFVSVTSRAGFDLDNATIQDMAAAWPHVETLVLQSYSERRTQNTLICLYAFARHCPELKILHLVLDATPVVLGIDMGRPSPQRRLKSLNVAQSPISKPTLAVARFISAIFPSLEDLSTDGGIVGWSEQTDERQVFVKRWGKVSAHLPELIAIRAEERARAQAELGT
ncbi:hypothetical protein B0H15DRAFT_792066 [Mycena belliarum]|uniref:Uncharacterized protein n=1 Tax=Mycena belliarum TaxID=1033014 RepID=A0AAD6TPC3_9AGAR|nr:hypothetical protein B0H15DRAFT_792066 [Mycena belliae]